MRRVCEDGDTYRDTKDSPLRKPLSAVRAKSKFRLHCFPAGRTPFLLRGTLVSRRKVMFLKNGVAMITGYKGITSFYRKQRDKKQAYIVVHPLEGYPNMPAYRTGPCLLLKGDCFWLNPADKEKHR